MPTNDLNGWRLEFTDDFPTDVALGGFPEKVSAKWAAYPSPWKDSSKNGVYSPHKVVTIENGILTKHIHTENGVHMVAAIMPLGGKSWTYGRYAVRWRADTIPGYKVAWMLWPASGDNKRDGEYDFPEMGLRGTYIGGFVHRAPVTVAPQGDCRVTADTDEWHTTVIEWSPGLLVYILDGIELLRTDVGVGSAPMRWVLQTETGLGKDVPPPADDVAGNVQIDWVAAFRYDPTAKAPETTRQLDLVAPATATGTVNLAVTASSDVTQVKWLLDGAEIGSDAGAPFGKAWDSTGVANGVHSLSAKARADIWFNTTARTITVANPWDVPVPASVSGTVSLALDHQYPWVKMLKVVIDGKELGSDATSPFAVTWDTTKWPNGAYTVYAKILGPLNDSGSPSWVNGRAKTIQVAN